MPENKKISDLQKISYESLIGMINYEGSLVWSRFNVLIFAQSIILTIILGLSGVAYSKDPIINLPHYIIAASSFIGLILSLLLLETTARGFTWVHYYMLRVREIEEKIDDEDLAIFKKGSKLRDNKTLYFYNSTGKVFDHILRPWYSRFVRTETAAYIVIILFMLTFFVMLLYNLLNQK